MTSKMEARYEQIYLVTLTKSHIVDHNKFYEQLKALVLPGTQVYGGQVPVLDPLVGTGVVDYEVVLAFPCVRQSERGRQEIRKWVSSMSVRESLLEAFGEGTKDPDPNLKEGEECGDEPQCADGIEEVDVEKEVNEVEITYSCNVSVNRPPRCTESRRYKDLPDWFEDVQAYVEAGSVPNKLFGDRIDPAQVSGTFKSEGESAGSRC
jgi:hypothetical protein